MLAFAIYWSLEMVSSLTGSRADRWLCNPLQMQQTVQELQAAGGSEAVSRFLHSLQQQPFPGTSQDTAALPPPLRQGTSATGTEAFSNFLHSLMSNQGEGLPPAP